MYLNFELSKPKVEYLIKKAAGEGLDTSLVTGFTLLGDTWLQLTMVILQPAIIL